MQRYKVAFTRLRAASRKKHFLVKMSAILVKSFVGQAEAYFEKELTHERETYYSEKGTGTGQWAGKGAEALDLKGDIKKEDFSRISRGVNPTTGKRFRRMTLGRTREINGELKRVKEIAGWDMVVSAPKSVSIAALIGQDERVRRAHEESVTDALERAEQQAQSNNGGGKKEQTSNLIVGRFSHDSARPSKDGFVAPQLHDHCFIMNATWRADGALKPLESLELHRAQSYIRSVYYTGLADRLQKLGYSIEIDRETGAPEIVGISKEYRQACSPRRAEILELAEKAGRNFRQLGLVNRREKIFDKDLIQEQHRSIDGLFNYQAKRVVETARITTPTRNPDIAKEAVTFALAKLSERESVFNPRVALLEANKRGIGQTSVAAIEAELETRRKEGKIKTVHLRDGQEVAFLSSDEKIENELPQHINAVQPKQTLQDEILTTKLSENSRAIVNAEFLKLSDEQKIAVKEILAAKTGVVTLEGRAGVGKTTTLSFVNKMAETAEYEVLGLAPTTGAAQELETAQITSATLQKLLASQDAPRDHKRFFIVDESSFVSSRQMDKFFREAVKPNDRVLLVGDTRQHEGVEAGKPFARIQREELATGAKVETIRRQTKETMRETVKKLSEGKIIEAVAEMRERGQVRETKDRDERHSSIVEAFTSEPEKSLVVAPRNADRQEINSKIHEALREAGKVGKAETEIKILRPRSELGGVEREFAAAYREGDVISYTRGSQENKIAAKSLAKVVKTDREQNLLTVEIKDDRSGTEAREITYNPKRLRGVSVWTEERIKVSEGDRLQFRAPFETKQTKIANGTVLEVSKITADALTLTTDKGKAVKLDVDQPHTIDYGYAVTSHSSQGKTIDRVLIHAETGESKQILNERMAYVAVSRARDEALIFTDDAEKLAFKMVRQVEKSEITRAKTETIQHAPQVSEIKPPMVTPAVEKSPTPEIKIQPAQQKTIATTGDQSKEHQETLIKEVLQMSRDSLAKQGIEPKPEAWKRFANGVINEFPNQKASESQKRALELLQKNLPESKRVSFAEKSNLEAIRAILKLAPENSRDAIVKSIFAKIEKQVVVEREVAVEPEIKREVRETTFEKAAGEPVKPTLKVRNFEAIGREKLIGELVAAARDEARAWTGKDLSCKQEKRLTKMYREVGDKKPLEIQTNDLKALQKRFSEQMPQPKNFIEATVLKFDNITDAEKSAALRGQITNLNELIKREEAQKSQSEKAFGQADRYDVFGRTDNYFTQELHRLKIEPEGKSYFELTREARDRGLMPPQSVGASEAAREQQTQQALYRMGIANALQEHIKRSLDEQGIKIEPSAERIINNTVDGWAKRQPTAADYKNVQAINQSSGRNVMPETKLEAQAYIYTNRREPERDKFSSLLATAAVERAAEIKQAEAQEREKSIERERNYRDYSQGYSR